MVGLSVITITAIVQKKPKCQMKWSLEKKVCCCLLDPFLLRTKQKQARSLHRMQVAQLLTVKRERELEEKVGKRESRSKQRYSSKSQCRQWSVETV